jgi:hypothetical protein
MHLGLLPLPPGRQAVKQTKRLLSCLVVWHLMLVAAALLGKGTDAFVNPLVAVLLVLLARLLVLLDLVPSVNTSFLYSFLGSHDPFFRVLGLSSYLLKREVCILLQQLSVRGH